jgi:hypothetical protein
MSNYIYILVAVNIISIGYFRKHCCFSTVHEVNKTRVGQITIVRPSTFVRFMQRCREAIINLAYDSRKAIEEQPSFRKKPIDSMK